MKAIVLQMIQVLFFLIQDIGKEDEKQESNEEMQNSSGTGADHWTDYIFRHKSFLSD